MYSYDNALFTVQVIRKHFFKDKPYQLYLFSDDLIMTDDITKPPKYCIKMNLTTTIKWIVEDKRIVAFEFAYNNNYKIVHGTKLNLLKEMMAGKIFYQPITIFYQFQMEMGSGMTGSVYRCMSIENDNAYYAIKKIDKLKIAQHEGGIPQLVHELSLLSSLSHPNIVKLKETYTDSQYYYIVMEYINGRTLHQELQSRNYGLSVAETIKFMRELLDAVSYIHERGVMHRDINPLNIMKADTIKLIDFGLARKIKNQLNFPTSGTPGYMAPEIINYNKDKQYDEKADIYSLGCLLYKLLTGENLFTPRHAKQSVYQVNKEGAFDLKKQAQHPEVNSVKMDQLFVLLPFMLETDPSNRLTAKVCMTVIDEIDNNNQNVDRLIKKILVRRSLNTTTIEEQRSCERISKKGVNKQSIDGISKKSMDELSIFTKKVMAQNQQKVILPQKKQA